MEYQNGGCWNSLAEILPSYIMSPTTGVATQMIITEPYDEFKTIFQIWMLKKKLQKTLFLLHTNDFFIYWNRIAWCNAERNLFSGIIIGYCTRRIFSYPGFAIDSLSHLKIMVIIKNIGVLKYSIAWNIFLCNKVLKLGCIDRNVITRMKIYGNVF